MGRGKPIIDQERCKGCDLCIAACPENILQMSEHFNHQGQQYATCITPERCTACLACAIICPDSAIEIWRSAK